MEIVKVALGDRSYPIYIQEGLLLSELGKLYREHTLGKRAAIITDENVNKIYSHVVQDSLKRAGISAEVISIPAGEEHKSLETAACIYERLAEKKFERGSTIIALGGGVIGDLAGFVAATFLRGLPLVQIPTTLLAQVDSSVGGKTGVNTKWGKNLIGIFYQPVFVLVDPKVLVTLPERERWAGLAEVVKYSLIKDRKLFEMLEAHLEKIASLKYQALSQIIKVCCQIKAEIVRQDEREQGLRRILNFGHTIGHALEAVTGYKRFLHGAAIAWGMLAAAYLSHKRGLLKRADFESIRAFLKRLKKPNDLADLDEQTILDIVHRDKKVRDKKIYFVLLEAIGQAVVQEVSDEELLEAWAYLKQQTC